MDVSTLAALARGYLTLQLGPVHLAPQESLVLFLALAAALVAAFRLARLASHEARHVRLNALRATIAQRATTGQPQRQHWYEQLAGLLASSPIVGKAEQQKLLAALAAAGIRRRNSLAMFIAAKTCSAVALASLLANILSLGQFLEGSTLVKLALFVGSLMLGWRLPDIVLSRIGARRRLQIEQGMPDALDLLVICAEAGLSLDQSIEEVGRELAAANPAVAEEFVMTAAEMRVLSDRGEALKNLVSRTGLGSLNSFAATLIQGIRFGTPLAESMRILASEMRKERVARIEERAARLPVWLTLPLTVFVMPSMFMILGTPAALRIIDFMRTLVIPTLPGVGQ